ncbi:MAG: amidohydrolase family protein [Gemmataceae bacterium]|nr:amidohydrolase family protein [Gemmataceae bacterium]MDW8267220.1 amidohydrolase family protein [Gemmataceae bacterium]
MNAAKNWVDLHVHLAALPTPDNGCLLSARTRRLPLARWLLWRLNIDLADPEGSNRRYVELLAERVRTSRWVRQVVLLGFDGVYDAAGRLDPARTHFMISNDYLFAVCRQFPEFLPGPSINPQRRDALDEVDRCAAAGAVLVKLLPNVQHINPAEPRYRPFYRRLAEHRLPLLVHGGHEFALGAVDQSLGDPNLVQPALDEGVTVITAHAGSTGLLLVENLWLRVQRLIRRYRHYYLDSSALCSPNRFLTALKIRRCPEMQERLLYGSDYPVPVLPQPFVWQLGWRRCRELAREANPLDRNVEVQRALGYRFASWPPGTRLAALPSAEAM